jgi:hypothetical protein
MSRLTLGIQYVQLMASLPALGPMLVARKAPINRVRLQARLRQLLRPEHLIEIQAVASIVAWPQQPLLASDTDFVRKARMVIPALRSETLRRLAHDRLELRTVIAALRRRHAGQDAPADGEVWGYGRNVDRIRKHWREPDFGVGHVFKWILPAKEKIDRDDASGLERIVLEAAWRQADRLIGSHDFDFEAVALYVIRWDLLDRWTRYDAEAAAARFDALVIEALKAASTSRMTTADLTEAAA